MRPGHLAAVSLAMRSTGVRARAGDDVTIRLPGDGAIRGRVEMSDGAAPPDDLRIRLGGTPQRVGADGAFLIEGVPPERYALRVDARRVPEVVRGDVVVAAGAIADVGTLVLTRGREVRGTVTDDAGRAIAGAEVSFVPVGIEGRLVAETDRHGRFRRALPTDRDCDVSATAGDLGATGRITGIVRAAGRPAPGRFVVLDRGAGDQPAAGMATTDADGRFELTVAGGTYQVSLLGPDDQFVDRSVSVEAGGEVRLDFTEPGSIGTRVSSAT